jgi:tetratricopeptide (TPR) repeat protein
MYLRALAGKEKALGPEHSSTLDTVNNLGILYRAQGKLAQAEQMYLRALAGTEKALGPEHSSTLYTVNNLESLYRDQDKLAQAGYEKATQSETLPAITTVRNLGLLYRDQNETKEAEKMFQRAVLGRDKVLGSDHSSTLEVINDLNNLQLAVEETDNGNQNTDNGHDSSGKRDRIKRLLRLKRSKTGHS